MPEIKLSPSDMQSATLPIFEPTAERVTYSMQPGHVLRRFTVSKTRAGTHLSWWLAGRLGLLKLQQLHYRQLLASSTVMSLMARLYN
jgi:hypothetical protein